MDGKKNALGAALTLAKEPLGQDRAVGLEVIAGLVRSGVELPQEARDVIAHNLELFAGTMPKTENGRPQTSIDVGARVYVRARDKNISAHAAAEEIADDLGLESSSSVEKHYRKFRDASGLCVPRVRKKART